MRTIPEIVELINSSEESFIKFASANDAGKTGGHQAGIYIPKNVISMFPEINGPRGENRNEIVTVKWEDEVEEESKLIYYGKAKNEYRITRLGRGIKFNSLFILIKLDYKVYQGFILDENKDEFLDYFNLNPSKVGKGIIIKPNDKNSNTQIDLFDSSDKNLDKEIDATFKPRARLLLQLGDQLIKNESIALVELVKNSYDADSNIVEIYMENVDNPEMGIIIIEDDGFGMTADIVENVWLEPGSDFKTKQIANLKGSPKYNRLPIGEKGIGRFGVHKLGNTIEMTTKAMNSKEVFVKINWADFDKYKYLEDVPIKIVEREKPQIFKGEETGTNIVISNLRKKWERGIAREVKRSITALASPFENNDSFKPSFDILDKPGWFEGLLKWDDVKDYSLFNFKVTIEGGIISKFEYHFTPWETMTKLFPNDIYEDDKLIETLKQLRFKNEKNKEDFFSLSDYNIGKVIFEGFIFDLDSFILKLGVSDKKGFKDYMKSNGGVKVFRDGLRVYDYGEPENDWLGLDYRRFQQPTKAVSNNLILGAVYLDRKDSSDLREKTNREGFVENNAYKAFKNSIVHSLDLIETLRYTDKRKLKEIYGPTPKSAPLMSTLGEAKLYVEDKVKDSEVKTQIVKYLVKIESDFKRVSENLLKAAGAGLSMSVVVHEVEKILYEVTKVLKVEKGSDRVLKLIKHLSSLIDGYAEIIRRSSKTTENIIDVIEQALFNVEYRLGSHNIEVIKEYKNYDGSKNIKIAKNLLIGSLMNLIDNSIYWLQQKYIKSIEDNIDFKKRIYINLQESDKLINLIVSDNGTGFLIPTDDITEPFVSAKSGGMGLGLHIASEIMEAQNGKLLFPEEYDFEIPEEYKDGATVILSFKK
ncbi:ATP-binding protein [Flaviramulus sp. BrNp1-15]|uniref:EcoRII N-terminal effector-binding domain-containing protein n=1 Tax=Flaviramulus sp. BrNp1-15 TaxID=2916754 RepID=UPI001EE874D4|nr:EcoRII N-terminal effector-binding domain-containing protein [Flaviramulus sp. BrNp1-15]ULC58207.1 ATP-binding protein [Flaviramulus sp. BrNp1-15]